MTLNEKVLKFTGFVEEEVNESQIETRRVRVSNRRHSSISARAIPSMV